ncbi:anti-sigma factor [Cohnella sp. LGH]|uniref:anti-sigma factor n=1 Tax=Cohnella sp. LGH TaxID=1619153 RepID=UPI001ADB331F|nr:anti-sigma factor [Cohnella sp. LGH]QTH44216.1 anti-sigma factor [Cohnella sp. LGH]
MERNLKDTLLEKSRYAEETKEELWDRIEARLDDEPATPSRAETRARAPRHYTGEGKRSMRKLQIAMGVAVAFMAFGIFLAMPAGTAFMKDVKQWFAPEKKVEVEVEGQKEETDQKLHQNEESKYVIYYDQERYKLVQEGGKDVITTKEPLPERYPEVSMTIEQVKDVKPEDLIKRLSGELSGKYVDVRKVEKVSEPVQGYMVRALAGKEWDSEVVVIYTVDNGKNGSFAITEKYFFEASEGHGARFYQMLKEFEVLSE